MNQQQIEKYRQWLNSQITICKKDKECTPFKIIFDMCLIEFDKAVNEKELSHIEFTSDTVDVE